MSEFENAWTAAYAAIDGLPIRDITAPGGELDTLRKREAVRAVVTAFVTKASETHVIVHRDALVETLARAIAAQGHCLDVENMMPIPKESDPWGELKGEQPMWMFSIPAAKETIDSLTPAPPSAITPGGIRGEG